MVLPPNEIFQGSTDQERDYCSTAIFGFGGSVHGSYGWLPKCIPDPNDPNGVCLTCKNNAANINVQQPVCILYKVTDMRLYKLGQVPGLEWSKRWSNRTLKGMDTWASHNTIIIEVSEGYTSTSLKLVVREFKPVKGDIIERSWVGNGIEKKSVTIPSYAIQDLTAAKNAYGQYIDMGGAEFFKGALNPGDEFLWMTYNMAIVTSDDKNVPDSERKLLKMLLRLWVAIRLNTKSTNIVGPERLGMPDDILDATHPTPGRFPIPPVMGNQIELILSLGFQDPLRAKILVALQELICSNKPGCWFTIYLCTFILLHNCSMITKHDSASYPFGAACKKADVLIAAGLSESQIRVIQNTHEFVTANAHRFEGTHACEDDYYYISQLYDQNWTPRTRI
ncbi:hypothetical protein V496_00621 [Pseudogymnoascus sp. VKM F-4515 (FW-2607)]|nr:hypothetical protein V496_00621 [Pseudogymnoascus sp. VKM F-4515 (FW-2607)]